VLDRLAQVDRALFEILNGRWQNPFFDAIMPVLSDERKFKPIFLIVFLGLMIFGKAKGRWAAAMVIPLLALSDQTSSNLLKHAFERVRPCHVLANVHLLAGCSGSWSMPSSHAANSAAAAVHFLLFYPRWRLPLAVLGFAIGYSRVYVGVHYPADVLVGFAVGTACAFVIQGLYRLLRWAWAAQQKRHATL
jgi:undecaprenyl-diphosphatase